MVAEDELDLATWRRVQAVNVEAPLLLCRALVCGMRERGWGRIVNVVSNTFHRPPAPGMAAYIAAKGALIGLTRALAVELGADAITVNAVAPGLTRTAPGDVPEERFARGRDAQAIPRTLTPEDYAGPVAFLASGDAAAITGQTLCPTPDSSSYDLRWPRMSAQTDTPPRRDNVEQVYKRVREAILTGEISAGTAMSQVALADELGVSRTPLREALRMLQSEGLVDAQANRRVTVKPISATDLEELVVMRVSLETEAVRLSVQRLVPEDVAALEGRLAEMAHFAEAKDYARWQAPHTAFHRGLTAPAGPRVNALLGRLSDHAERYRRVHIARSSEAWPTAGHREILDACKAGERELTAGLMAEHLSRTAFDVMELLEPGYEPARLRQTLEDVRARPRRKR